MIVLDLDKTTPKRFFVKCDRCGHSVSWKQVTRDAAEFITDTIALVEKYHKCRGRNAN